MRRLSMSKETLDYLSFRNYYENIQILKKQLLEANQESKKYNALFRKARARELELRQKLIDEI